jgi:uncharacterized membrane-anchored protein YhcB (DUF1043 family)
MITWVLFLGIGLVVGVIAGLYFARLDDVSNKQKKVLQQKLESAEQQLKTYQSQVTEHFLTTASLVNSMTESYKAVHEHLAMGARELCDSQVNVAQLEMPTTKLLGNVAAHEAVTEKSELTPEIRADEKEAKPAAEQQTPEQPTVATQKPQPQEEEPAAEARKPDSAISEEPSQSEEASAAQPEKEAEQQKEVVEAVQPASTPESLHVEDTETGEPKSIKDSEQTAPVNVSRMVH